MNPKWMKDRNVTQKSVWTCSAGRQLMMSPQPTACATWISLSYLVAMTPLTDQFALYNLLKDLGQATSAISTWYTWEVCQPLFSTFLNHLFPKTQLFCWLFSWSDVLSCFLLTSTQLTKNSLLSEFSRNMLLSPDFTSPVQAGSQRADKKFHVNANLIKSACSSYLDLGTQSLGHGAP